MSESNKSLAQELAELSDEDRERALEGVDQDALLHHWAFWARPNQLEPGDDWWTIWAVVGGRGIGKTRTGAEWVREKAAVPGTRIGLVGRTSADTRDVMIAGESGILNVDPTLDRSNYSPSNRRITWPNGSVATAFSADTPDQTRGPQFHYSWCDEIAAWNHIPGVDGATAWDNTQIATRLGDHPRTLVTTTPKRLPAMQDLLKREGDDVIVTRGSTLENAGNLKPKYLKFIFGLYAGTRLEQQELYGIMMDDVEGALWELDNIDQFRVKALPVGLPYKVIAVDPSVADEPKDECGIIVAGATGHKTRANRHTFVIEDRTVHGSPAEWAKAVVAAYNKWKCPVVVEVNQGGALVRNSIHAIDESIPIIEVRAYKGKAVRAEPVYLKYDQGKVHHLGNLGELESQMTSWVPGESKKSPDRVDALVYAVTALVIEPNRNMTTTRTRARTNRATLPGVRKIGNMTRTKSGLIIPGNGRSNFR